MLKIYGYLLGLVLVVSCRNLKELHTNKILDVSNPTVLIPDTGLFKDDSMWPDSSREFQFSYRDLRGLKEESLVLRPDVPSKLYIEAPTYLTEFRGGYPYLVYPGEQIDAKLEPDNFVSYSVRGNEKRNRELQCLKLFHDKRREKAYSLYTYRAEKDTSLEMLMANEQERKARYPVAKQNRLQLIDSLAKRYSVSLEFKQLLTDQMKADSIVTAIYFYKQHEKIYASHHLTEKKVSELLSAINAIADQKDLFSYYRALDYMLEVLIQMDTIKRVIRQDADFIGQFKIASSKFKGQGRNYLLSKMMYEAIVRDIPVVNSYTQKYRELCSDDSYRKIIAHQMYLKAAIASNINKNDGNTLLRMESKEPFSMEKLYADNNGNILLLDFWASWCAPCRDAFPQSRLLKEKYAGKRFKIIYISLDRDIPRWAKASYLENIDPVNSFLLLNVKDSKFVKEFDLQTIPRYMLIGKDGKVISADAPGPGNRKLSEMIHEGLKL